MGSNQRLLHESSFDDYISWVARHDSDLDSEQSEKSETTYDLMPRLLEVSQSPNDEKIVEAKSREVLMMGGLGLTEPPKEEEWLMAAEIQLMDNKISKLPEKPMCPELLALFLQRNYKLRKIPPSFFEGMGALQVLNLSKTGIKSLPESLFNLVRLKRLFLNGCDNFMMLPPEVGKLKGLEVLDLEGTEIMYLPEEVKNLTYLKCLNVSFDGSINQDSIAIIHVGVISALSKLEELNIGVNPDDERWAGSVENIIKEVCSLTVLDSLKFYFPEVKLLRHFIRRNLSPSCFRLTVGRHFRRVIPRLPPDVEFELEQWDRCHYIIFSQG